MSKHSLRRPGMGEGELGMTAERWSYKPFFISVFISGTLSLRSCCECISFPHKEADVQWDWGLQQLILRI